MTRRARREAREHDATKRMIVVLLGVLAAAGAAVFVASFFVSVRFG